MTGGLPPPERGRVGVGVANAAPQAVLMTVPSPYRSGAAH